MLLWLDFSCAEGPSAPAPTDPWADAAYWTDPGPFAPLLDISNAPELRWEVQFLTSPDGLAWSGDPTTVAFAFSSLDLLVVPDVAVVVSGATAKDESLGVDAPWGHVFALTSPDLHRWGTKAWPVLDAEEPRLVDPALHCTPEGEVRAAYYSAAGDDYGSIPPEEYPGEHVVRVADWSPQDDAFVELADPVFSLETLVDPVVCRWDGESHLFATVDGRVTHAVADGWEHAVDDRFEWHDAQVPYCFERGASHAVVAQAGGGFGAPTVRAFDGADWSEPADSSPERTRSEAGAPRRWSAPSAGSG